MIMKYGIKKYTKRIKLNLKIIQLITIVALTFYQPSAKTVLKDELNIMKNESILELKTKNVLVGDTAYSYIKFKNDTQILEPIYSKLEKNDTPDTLSFIPFKSRTCHYHPKWWKPILSNSTIIYSEINNDNSIHILHNSESNEYWIKTLNF